MKTNIDISHRALNLLGFIAIIVILFFLKTYIVPIIIAVILSVLVFPVQKFFERKMKCSRLFATIFTISILLITTGLLIFLITYQLQSFVNNGEDYTKRITEVYANLASSLENAFGIPRNDLIPNKKLPIEGLVQGNFEKVGVFLSESGSVISDMILIPIYCFFFLYYRAFFRAFTYKVFNKQSKSFINGLIKKVYVIQQNYLNGLLKVIIIVGTLNTIGLLALGIDNAVFFGFFAAILILVPYIGVLIGALLPAILALATKDSAWYAVGVIAIFGFIQFIEGNFITPKITGSKVSINAFIALSSLILFAMLWGIAGMILALPLTATLKVIFDNTPGYEAYGYLIGEPVDKQLESSRRFRLKKWKKIRKKKKASTHVLK